MQRNFVCVFCSLLDYSALGEISRAPSFRQQNPGLSSSVVRSNASSSLARSHSLTSFPSFDPSCLLDSFLSRDATHTQIYLHPCLLRLVACCGVIRLPSYCWLCSWERRWSRRKCQDSRLVRRNGRKRSWPSRRLVRSFPVPLPLLLLVVVVVVVEVVLP